MKPQVWVRESTKEREAKMEKTMVSGEGWASEWKARGCAT